MGGRIDANRLLAVVAEVARSRLASMGGLMGCGRVYTRPQPMSPPIDANRLRATSATTASSRLASMRPPIDANRQLAVVAAVARAARPGFGAYAAPASSPARVLGDDG